MEQNNEEPTDEMLANMLNVETSDIQEAMNSTQSVVSLYDTVYGEGEESIFIIDQLKDESQSNEKTINYLTDYGVKNIMLGHLSNENNFPELAYKSVLEQIENTSGSGCKALGPTIFGLPISAYSCAGTFCSFVYLIFTKKTLDN